MENANRVREMKAIRDELTRLWKLSPFYAEQVEFFETTILKLDHLQVDTALSMSIGRMSNIRGDKEDPELPTGPAPWGYDRGYRHTSLNSLVELVVFESFIGILRTKFDIPNNKVYFQEPDLHPVDIDFLDSLGYVYIPHPIAFAVISPTTFLFGAYVFKDLVGALFLRAIPALAVLTPLEVPTIPDPGLLRVLSRFLSAHVTRKLGPIHPRDYPPDNFDWLTIDIRVNSKLRDLALYWKPNDPKDLKPTEWIMEMDWVLKPGPTGIETQYSAAFIKQQRNKQRDLLKEAIESENVSMGG